MATWNEDLETQKEVAHFSATGKEYQKAAEELEVIKKVAKVYPWDVAFYSVFYLVEDGKNLDEKLQYEAKMNKAVIDALSIVMIRMDDTPESTEPFQTIFDHLVTLTVELLELSQKEYETFLANKNLSRDILEKRKKLYLIQLKKILSISENYINALGSLTEFTSLNPDYIWHFFKFNDQLLSIYLAYEENEAFLEKKKELVQIIQLKEEEYQPEKIKKPIFPSGGKSQSAKSNDVDRDGKWWEFWK